MLGLQMMRMTRLAGLGAAMRRAGMGWNGMGWDGWAG